MAGATDRNGFATREPRVDAADDEPPAEGTSDQPADEEADDGSPRPPAAQPTGLVSGYVDGSDELPTAKAHRPPLQDSIRTHWEVGPDGAELDVEVTVRDGSRSAATFLGLLLGALAAALLTILLCRSSGTSGYMALIMTLGVFFAVLAAGTRFVRTTGDPVPMGRVGRGRRVTGDRERGA